MKLFHVTITGADDSVAPEQLLDLSREYPFVEWGILFKDGRAGTPRYPTQKWIDELIAVQDSTLDMNLSAHLCGQFAADLLNKQSLTISPLFKRVQINCVAEDFHNADLDKLVALRFLFGNKAEFIFQYRHTEEDKLRATDLHQYNPVGGAPNAGSFALLYDVSGGKGVLPNLWPDPPYGMRFGYAGGLNPDNLHDKLNEIANAAGDQTVWVDMETGVRGSNDEFDLVKVRQCLELAWHYT